MYVEGDNVNFDTSSTENVVDLRSDTVTRPTDAMRNAMANAAVGDDQNAEDPTVNELEARCAALLGKEAAVFMPSGTMGNLASVLTHCDRGEEIVLGDESHILWYEFGGISALGGVFPRVVETTWDGSLSVDRIASAILSPRAGYPGTGVIEIENTHNRCGGTVLPISYLAELQALAQERGLPIHMDGARIFNAAAYLGVPASEIAAYADTVQFCFSKGLAAPVGSMVVGSRDLISRVHYHRKILGGAMRQAGVIAAAALVSVDQMIDRLPQDHVRARVLAEAIADLPAFSVNLDTVKTNLVIFKTEAPQAGVVEQLKARGVLVSDMGSRGIRMVTHYEITDNHIDRTVAALREIANA